jgi:hypothetical protein
MVEVPVWPGAGRRRPCLARPAPKRTRPVPHERRASRLQSQISPRRWPSTSSQVMPSLAKRTPRCETRTRFPPEPAQSFVVRSALSSTRRSTSGAPRRRRIIGPGTGGVRSMLTGALPHTTSRGSHRSPGHDACDSGTRGGTPNASGTRTGMSDERPSTRWLICGRGAPRSRYDA